jgi:prephenate dehydrogenase
VRRFLTPSFKRHLEAARKHLTMDTEMFCEFTACNPCFADAVRQYERILARVASGDLRSVASEAARWYREE